MKHTTDVYHRGVLVGSLFENEYHQLAFSYADSWLRSGFSVSPFSLPLKEGVFVPNSSPFNGLFGVFSDSLPDLWGRLLVQLKDNPQSGHSEIGLMNMADSSALGSLTYGGNSNFQNVVAKDEDLDLLSKHCGQVIKHENSELLPHLYQMGVLCGGSRPKANMLINNEVYIVKFNTSNDSLDSGLAEYRYYLCARASGIEMSDSLLLPSKTCSGYFATKRFDFKNGKKLHMISVAGLLECDYSTPCLDYSEIFKLVKILTNNDEHDTLQLFRRMVFNVLTCNRDDHAKNFAFLYDDETKKWALSPAYDLTYSDTFYHEHVTSVNYKGKDIQDSDLIAVGLKAGLKKEEMINEIANIRRIVVEHLSEYLK